MSIFRDFITKNFHQEKAGMYCILKKYAFSQLTSYHQHRNRTINSKNDSTCLNKKWHFLVINSGIVNQRML